MSPLSWLRPLLLLPPTSSVSWHRFLGAGMEGREVGSFSSDDGVFGAILLLLGLGFAGFDVDGGTDGDALMVEDVDGGKLDGGVAWFEEGGTDGGANVLAFLVNGGEGNGDMRDETLEDTVRGDGGGVGLELGEGLAKGDFLVERVGGEVRKSRDMGDEHVVTSSEWDSGEAEGFVDDGSRVLGHDDRRWRVRWDKGRKSRNSYRSHVTKDGPR